MTVWGWVGESGGGVWWFKTYLLKKIAYGEGAKKEKKTNKSTFLAKHTYIKLTLVNFFSIFFCTLQFLYEKLIMPLESRALTMYVQEMWVRPDVCLSLDL